MQHIDSQLRAKIISMRPKHISSPAAARPATPPPVNTLRMAAGSITATYNRTNDKELGVTGRPKPHFQDREQFTATGYEEMADLISDALAQKGFSSMRRDRPLRMAASFQHHLPITQDHEGLPVDGSKHEHSHRCTQCADHYTHTHVGRTKDEYDAYNKNKGGDRCPSCEGGWQAASFRTSGPRTRHSPTRAFSDTISAANFGAHAFGGNGGSLVRAVMHANNLVVPASDIESAIGAIDGFVAGKALYPKRFGDETFVQRTTSSSIIKLTADNYTEGNTLVLMTPLLSSFKGGVLVQMPDTWSQVATAGPTATVVGYITPDRDPEKLGTALNVLAASLKVSAPTVVGGTDTTTAQISLEMAETAVNPMSIRPGKLGPVAKGRHAPITIIGSEGHKIVGFTANMPDNQVRRFSRYDKQNEGLVRIPGGVPLSDKGGEIVSSQPFLISVGTIDQNASAAGKEQGTGWLVNYNEVINDLTTLWRLSENVDSNKHMLYGNFHASVDFDYTHSEDAGFGSVRLLVTYSDDTIGELSSAWTTPRKDDPHHFHASFSSHADTALSAKAGLLIIDMELVWTVSFDPSTILTKHSVNIRFDEVAAATTYLCALMSGAKVGSQVNVEMITDTEVRPDPSGDIATFVSATSDLPYDPDFIPAITMIMDRVGMSLVMDERTMEAGAFGKGLREFFGKAFRFFAPVAGHVLDGVAPGIGLGNAVNQTLDHGGAMLGRRRRNGRAASFGSGRSDAKDTQFMFPLVSPDSKGFTTTVAKVCKGRGSGSPAWLNQLSPGTFHAKPSKFTGSSHGLAFVMAYAKSLGYPAKPGLYSGEVMDVYSDEHTLEFTVLPVDLTPEKIAAYGDVLIALTPVGWWTLGNRARLMRSTLFGPTNFHCVEVKTPPDNPGPAFTISLRK